MKRRSALLALGIGIVTAATAGAEIRKSNFSVSPGESDGASIVCGEDKVPIAGGFELDQSTDELYPQTSYPDFRRWKVNAYNRNGPGELSGKTIAMCVKDPDLHVRVKNRRVQGDADEAQATAKCAQGSKAIGGGGHGPRTNAIMRGSFPTNGREGWGARFQFLSEGDIYSAFVICDETPKGTSLVETSSSANPRRRGATLLQIAAECVSGSKVVGGGFYSSSDTTNYLESRVARDRFWRVTANVEVGVALNAYAICQR